MATTAGTRPRGKKPVVKQRMGNPNSPQAPGFAQTQSSPRPAGTPDLQWPSMMPTNMPYPEMPSVSDTKPPLYDLGATGTAIFSGVITSEEYNPDFHWKDGIAIYEQMRRNDAQVNAVLLMAELLCMRAQWKIEPASDDPQDVEIASFVETCLFHDMWYETSGGQRRVQTWRYTLQHILMLLQYGFSTFEICYKIEDGWVKWARWIPLLPRTIWRWWVGDDNELVGIQQWTFKDYSYQFVNIPADKLLHFAWRQEGNNFEGISLLRSAYKHWFYKQNFEKIAAIGIERNAVIPPVVKLPENWTAADVGAAQAIGQNMRANEQMSVTLPWGWDLEFPKNQQKYAANAQEEIQYHDVMIARNFLCQFLNFGSTETGAYNLNASQQNTFFNAVQAVAEIVSDAINNGPLRRLVDYNYDNVGTYPRIVCSKIAAQDISTISAALQQLANGPNPVLHPSPELEDFMCDLLGIPKPPHNAIETTNPTDPNDPARPENDNAANHADQQPEEQSGTPVTSETAQQQLSLSEELHLLRETLGYLDAVDRGEQFRVKKKFSREEDAMSEEAQVFFNPYHRGPGPGGGQFAPRGAGGGEGVTHVPRGQGRTRRTAGGRRELNPDHPANAGRVGGRGGSGGARASGSQRRGGMSDEEAVRHADARMEAMEQRAMALRAQSQPHLDQATALRNKADALDAAAQAEHDAQAASNRGRMTYQHNGPLEQVAEFHAGDNMVIYHSPVHGDIDIEAHSNVTGEGTEHFSIQHDGTYSVWATHHQAPGQNDQSENLTPNEQYMNREQVQELLTRLGIANEFHGTPAGESHSYYLRNGVRTPESLAQEQEDENGPRPDHIENYHADASSGETEFDAGGHHFHVSPNESGGYDVARDGETLARGVDPHQAEAIMLEHGVAMYTAPITRRPGDYGDHPHIALQSGHDAYNIAAASRAGDLGGEMSLARSTQRITDPRSAELRQQADEHAREASRLENAAERLDYHTGNYYGMLEAARTGAVSDIQTSERDMQEAQRVFHNPDLTVADLETMVGGQPGATVSIKASGGSVSLSMEHPDTGAKMDMDIERDSSGKLVAHVGYATSGNATEIQHLPDGSTREILSSRSATSGKLIIDAMHAMGEGGIDRIETTAGGSGMEGLNAHQMNGYRTWVRLGFTGHIADSSVRAQIRAKFGPGITRVEQMQETRERRSWWNDHGSGGHVTFNFHSPYSRGVLARLHAAAHRNDNP